MAERNLKIRSFNDAGVGQARIILEMARRDNISHINEIDQLLDDPEYTNKPISDSIISSPICRDFEFSSKQSLIDYFAKILTPKFLDDNRKNANLWTWLALAFYDQLMKSAHDVVRIASAARWIYDPDNYRLSMRHFIAGPIYLAHDLYATSKEVKDILFCSPVKEFGGFIDAVTYKMEGTRLPASMQVAARLYYDPQSENCLKRGAVSQNRKGSIRELLRVISHFAQTYDFYGVEDAQSLWDLLPSQFDAFKRA